MLEIDGLHAFYGKSHALHGVSLRLRQGEVVSLLGRNGAGRSTLVKAVMGLVDARGAVRWRGEPLLGLRPCEIARLGVGYVPESRDVFPGLTVHQNLVLGEQRRRGSGARRWTAEALYAMFPRLAERRHTDAGVLSGGEQQMLTLARTLMGDPALVMVDEPTEGLAPQVVERVAETLLALRREGLAVLLVEQKLTIALDVADRCCVMGQGRIVFDGTPAELGGSAQVRREWLEV